MISKNIKLPGYYCVECESLCQMYEQGLCCSCDQPWVTEVMNPEDYPKKWIHVTIMLKKDETP